MYVITACLSLSYLHVLFLYVILRFTQYECVSTETIFCIPPAYALHLMHKLVHLPACLSVSVLQS